MSAQALQTVFSRAMGDPAFADLLFSNPEQALSGYDLTAEDVSRLKSMSRAQFDQLAKAVPEDSKSFSIIFVD